MILDFFDTIVELVRSQLIGIPLENPMSYAYVALNIILTIFATLIYSED